MPHKFLPENTETTLELLNKNHKILDKYGFYLAGGTALAFQLKYRISYDLDFFTRTKFDANKLLLDLQDIMQTSNITSDQYTLTFTSNKTNVSFFHYPYKLLKKFDSYKSIKLASLLDIALMKITAIGNRGLEKDFADLYYASKQLKGLKPILDNLEKKFPNSQTSHYLKSLVYFENSKEGRSLDIIIKNYDWSKIQKYFTKEIEDYTKNIVNKA